MKMMMSLRKYPLKSRPERKSPFLVQQDQENPHWLASYPSCIAKTKGKNISYVVQDPLLIQDSIFYNITLGNKQYAKEDVIKAAQKAHIHDFIMSLPMQYNTIIGDRGTLLSSGQKQCIALARAFIKEAPIYIMDEATSALDPELEALVLNEMTEVATKNTIIIITHQVSTTIDADRVYVIDNGMIVEEGKPKQLFKKESLYRSLAIIQNIKI